jgi:hypothetical protein
LPQSHTLAASRAAKNDEALSTFYFERELVEDGLRTIALTEVLDYEERVHVE